MQVRQESLTLANVYLDSVPQMIEHLGCDWLVDITPINGLGGRGFLDDESILGRAAGASTSFNHDGAVTGKTPFPSSDGMLGEAGARKDRLTSL